MEFSSLTSTDTVVLVVILIVVIVLATLLILSFFEKKKMVAVATKNMAVILPFKLGFTAKNTVVAVKQIFETDMGKILFTTDSQEYQDSRDDIIVLPKSDPANTPATACVSKVKINNRTKHDITVSASGPLPEFDISGGTVTPAKPFNATVAPIKVPANNEVESVIVANGPFAEVGTFVAAFEFSNDVFKKLL